MERGERENRVSVRRRDKAAERFDQRRQVVLDGVPDYGGAKVPVGVDGEVSKIDHLPPGDFRIRDCDFCRNVVCRLANHSQVVNYGFMTSSSFSNAIRFLAQESGLKRRWRDGTAQVIYEPLEFMEKLAALVPPPRFNLVRYSGVLAPSSGLRRRIIPARQAEDSAGEYHRNHHCNHSKKSRIKNL